MRCPIRRFQRSFPVSASRAAGPAAVVDEVEPAGDVDRRELEQRPAGVAPEFAERRLDALGGQVPGARPVEPEERPVDGFRLRLRRLLRLERDVGVVDVGRALEQLVGEQRAAGDQQHRGDDRGDRLPPVVLPERPAAAPGARRVSQAPASRRSGRRGGAPLGLRGDSVEELLDPLANAGDHGPPDQRARSGSSAPRRRPWCPRPRASARRCRRGRAPAGRRAPCRRSGSEACRR